MNRFANLLLNVTMLAAVWCAYIFVLGAAAGIAWHILKAGFLMVSS